MELHELTIIKKEGKLHIEFFPTKRPVMYGYGYTDHTLKKWVETKVTIEVADESQDDFYNIVSWMFNQTSNFCNVSFEASEALRLGVSAQFLEKRIVIRDVNEATDFVNVLVKKAFVVLSEEEQKRKDKFQVEVKKGSQYLVVYRIESNAIHNVTLRGNSFADVEKQALLLPSLKNLMQITNFN
jgi:uncharacterized protein YqfB (UPF0267 family)